MVCEKRVLFYDIIFFYQLYLFYVMVQKFKDTNIIGKLSKYISICAYQSWELEIMPQIKPYLVNKGSQNGS